MDSLLILGMMGNTSICIPLRKEKDSILSQHPAVCVPSARIMCLYLPEREGGLQLRDEVTGCVLAYGEVEFIDDDDDRYRH
jgi:hypothetical protein